jgi:hypothetical protein
MTKLLWFHIIAMAVCLGLCIYGAIATFSACPLAAVVGYGALGLFVVMFSKYAIECELENIIKKERA